MNAGTQVTWMGRKAKVLGTVPGFVNLRKIELEGGEAKEVLVTSLLEDVPADPRSNLPADVQNALRVCEAVLVGPNATILANILGGSTRGPDNPNDTAKSATTAILRQAAFGKGGAALGQVAPVAKFSGTALGYARQVSQHFHDHVSRAASRLGLLA